MLGSSGLPAMADGFDLGGFGFGGGPFPAPVPVAAGPSHGLSGSADGGTPWSVSGVGGSQSESSGTSGDYGHATDLTKGDSAQINNRFAHDYEQRDRYSPGTWNQAPISRGGLQPTATAVNATGSYIGNTAIPSGQYSYGFSTFPGGFPMPYMGVGWTRNFPSTGPGVLPATSTSSVDINIMDRGPSSSDFTFGIGPVQVTVPAPPMIPTPRF